MDKDNSKTFLLVLLGLLTAFGPFVTDMYLPALPAMADDFGTSSSMVQLGLTTSMIGLACGQLFFGPLSDKYGRRTPLLTAMWLFLGSTVLCIFAADIEQFVFLRFVQGIAGSGGIVISRSVATDKFSGRELAKMLALIGAINGIAPVAAPIVGGTLTGIIGWRGIFTILLGLGIVLLAGSFRFSESLPAANRSTVEWADILRGFKTTLRNRRYLCYIFQLSVRPGHIVRQHRFVALYRAATTGSAFQFSICFAVNAVAIGRSRTLGQVPPPENGTSTGVRDDLLAVAEAIALAAGCNFWVYELLMFALLFAMGLTFTTSTALAMESARRMRGRRRHCGRRMLRLRRIVRRWSGSAHLLSTGTVFVVCAVCSWLCIRLAMRLAPPQLAAA
ncbi:MAG: MFS transporter [Alistipes onderdonkii]